MKTAKKAISPKIAKSLAKKRSLPKKKQKTQRLGYAFFMKPTNAMRPSSICYNETQLNALIKEYEGKGDSENVARVKAENVLLPAKFFTKCVPKKHTSSFKQKTIEMHTP